MIGYKLSINHEHCYASVADYGSRGCQCELANPPLVHKLALQFGFVTPKTQLRFEANSN